MIIKITDRLHYWGQLLLLPVYWLSFLVPRDKKFGFLAALLEEDLQIIPDIYIFM